MSGRVKLWTDERLALIDKYGPREAAARISAELGVPVTFNAARMARRDKPRIIPVGECEIEQPEPDEVPLDELIEARKRRFAQKRMHEETASLIGINVKSNLPLGILLHGDPHVDDDGTDIALLEEYLDLQAGTDGLYGASVGDATNNWVGRLAKLYGDQSTSAREAWRLAEWFIGKGRGKWLYLVGGNHDLWSGSGDPLHWIAGQAHALYQGSEARVALRFPNKAEVRINCRHDFAGASIYNPAHGPMKALTWGIRDHVAVCGHKHTSGQGIVKDPDSKAACLALQVGSYKTFDRYAKDRGFRDQMLGPACLLVIDPALPSTHPGRVLPFWDPRQGAEYLGWLRKRKAA